MANNNQPTKDAEGRTIRDVSISEMARIADHVSNGNFAGC